MQTEIVVGTALVQWPCQPQPDPHLECCKPNLELVVQLLVILGVGGERITCSGSLGPLEGMLVVSSACPCMFSTVSVCEPTKCEIAGML